MTTPGRLVKHLKTRAVTLEHLLVLAVDEADLVLSYGYAPDLESIARALPAVYQAMLVSATLEGGVQELNQLLLHDPAVVRLEDASAQPAETGAGGGQLKEFAAYCSTDDKYLITYTLLKLGVLSGKTLIFVNDIDRCYRLKLLLERFGINAAVLNAELPANSRHSIVVRVLRAAARCRPLNAAACAVAESIQSRSVRGVDCHRRSADGRGHRRRADANGYERARHQL